MEEYFHLNLKKFVANFNGGSEDVKPNAAKMPGQGPSGSRTRGYAKPAPAQSADGFDNTDPYNSTGRFNLKTADG